MGIRVWVLGSIWHNPFQHVYLPNELGIFSWFLNNVSFKVTTYWVMTLFLLKSAILPHQLKLVFRTSKDRNVVTDPSNGNSCEAFHQWKLLMKKKRSLGNKSLLFLLISAFNDVRNLFIWEMFYSIWEAFDIIL